jgi:hypothetical protein
LSGNEFTDEHGYVTLLWRNGFRARVRWPGLGPRRGKRRESPVERARFERQQRKGKALMRTWLDLLERQAQHREVLEAMEAMVADGTADLVGRDENGEPIIRLSTRGRLAARRAELRGGPQ